MNYKELIEQLRSFEIDHEPDGWPGVRMRQISAMCDAIEYLLAENERLNHNLTSTEQTMREYQELAAARLEEIAKYRDAPVVAVSRALALVRNENYGFADRCPVRRPAHHDVGGAWGFSYRRGPRNASQRRSARRNSPTRAKVAIRYSPAAMTNEGKV